MSNNGMSENKTGLDLGRPALLALMLKGSITPDDVAALRREVFCDRSVSRTEIEDLFGLDAVVRPTSPAWTDFFVEAVTDHLVWDVRPTGILEDVQARWLIDKVDRSKTVASFAILINILDEAHRVPRWFEGVVRESAVAVLPGLMSNIEDRAVSRRV